MSKLKNLLKNTFSYVGGLFSTHPVTFFSICAGTLTAFVYAFFMNDTFNLGNAGNEPYEALLSQLMLIALIFGMFAFCIESSPLRERLPLYAAIPVYAVLFLLSFGLGSVFLCALTSGDAKGMMLYNTSRGYVDLIGKGRIECICFGLLIIQLMLGICFSFRRLADTSFSLYLANLFSKHFFAQIVFGVLVTGVATLTGIFTALLWGHFGDIFFPILMLIFGGYMVMRIIASFTEEAGEINAFISVLLRYILLPMCMIGFVIIYLYIFKILLMREFPSNEVFDILTALFVCSMPIAYMCRAFSENTPAFFVWSARLLPYIFTPFILLQLYPAGIRVRQYGLTPKRYIGLLFVGFEILYIVLYAILERKKEKKMRSVLLIFAGFALIATWIPALNAIDLPNITQAHAVRTYLQKAGEEAVPEEVYSRGYAGYDYLTTNSKDYLQDHFSKKEQKKLKELFAKEGIPDPDSPSTNYRTWNAQNNTLDLDVSKYDRMQSAYLLCIGMDEGEMDLTKPCDPKKALLYLNKDGRIPPYVDMTALADGYEPDGTADLSGFADLLRPYATKDGADPADAPLFEDAMESSRLIRLEKGSAFYLTDVDLRYRDQDGEILAVLLQGYWLGGRE